MAKINFIPNILAVNIYFRFIATSQNILWYGRLGTEKVSKSVGP